MCKGNGTVESRADGLLVEITMASIVITIIGLTVFTALVTWANWK